MTKTQPHGIIRPRIAPEGEALAGRFRALLEALAGRTVTVHPRQGNPLPPITDAVIARYSVDAAKGSAHDRYLLADLPAMAALGGARAMLSHGAVEDALQGEQWPDALVDNCLDMLINIAQLWDRPDRGVRLVSTYEFARVSATPPTPSATSLPDDVRAALARPSRRLDLDLGVAGYGGGAVALLRS